MTPRSGLLSSLTQTKFFHLFRSGLELDRIGAVAVNRDESPR